MEKLSVKGYPDRIELVFTKNLTANEAYAEVRELSGNEKSFFTKDNISVSYSGIEFSYDEEMLFEKEVKKAFGKSAKLIKQKKLSFEEIKYSLSDGNVICKVVEKSLRSGEEVISEGDILVIGDVNPGASVIARGNITVTGALRGSAHIKKRGKIYSTYMAPAQIRIGKIYSYNKKPKNVGPAVAMAENGEIIIESL